jgi:DNA-binding transcriptional MocR family regulator
MHTLGWLAAGQSDRDVSQRALDAGVCVWPLSACYCGNPTPPSALIFGFAGYPEEEIAGAMEVLARVVTSNT